MSDEDTIPGRDGSLNPAGHIGSLHRFGCEIEFTLPAGTVLKAGGREHVLLEPARVRASQPMTVWEGRVEEGSEADREWPSCPEGEFGGVEILFVKAEEVAIPPDKLRRRVAMLRASESDVPDWLRERLPKA